MAAGLKARSTGAERGVVRGPKVAASAGWAVSTFWRWTRTARGSGAPGTLCLRRNWFALVGALEPTSARCPFGEAALSASPLLKVAGCQTGVLGDSGKDARAQFLVVMKGEDEVRPIRPGKRAV